MQALLAGAYDGDVTLAEILDLTRGVITSPAAVSLATRRVIADPFTRTDQVRSLLEMRAAQLV